MSGSLSNSKGTALICARGLTIARGKIVEMDILADPERLSRLDLSAIER